MKKIISAIIIASLTTALLSACGNPAANPKENKNEEARTTEASEASSTETAISDSADMEVGGEYHGFTLEDIYESESMDSDIYSFEHKGSGAELVYIKNSDTDCAFDITYKTPYVDETDTNHVFEHAILAGSEKYPATDVFFDMYSKAYFTYLNAQTSPTYTHYPIASCSQEQLIKLMDVYMSCMVAPAVLNDENFFKREAIRFELENPEDDISINGTVFSEDLGSLTSNNENAYNAAIKCLYPGEIASNAIGMAEYHYDDLTYEHTIETYERCYHFDNSLITLYGDLDIDRFLEYLDSEYLSKVEVNGTDLSKYEDGLTEAGHVEETVYIPAYEGDSVEDSGQITYLFDMQEEDAKTIEEWSILTEIINEKSSFMNKEAVKRNIPQNFEAFSDTSSGKAYTGFSLYYANAEDADDFRKLADDTLNDIAANGVSEELLESVLKRKEMSDIMLRDNQNVGFELASSLSQYWAAYGKTDCFKLSEEVLKEMEEDKDQKIIRKLAEGAINARRTAFVTCIPKPGMAEEYEEERDNYLKKMKEDMSDEEIAELIKETEEFNKWNDDTKSNSDFTIDPAELPETKAKTFETSSDNGIEFYNGKVDAGDAGKYSLLFDLSGMTAEDIRYLIVYTNMLGDLKTKEHNADELDILFGRYLYGLRGELIYPDEDAGEYHRPMLKMSWSSLGSDFGVSLDLLKEVLCDTDIEDYETISYLLSSSIGSMDWSKYDCNELIKIYGYAMNGANADSYKFMIDTNGKKIYEMTEELIDDLSKADEEKKRITESFEKARSRAFTRENLIFAAVTPENEKEEINKTAAAKLADFPEKTDSVSEKYELPKMPDKLAVIVESSMNGNALVGDFNSSEDFRGAYLPYAIALNDKYTVPEIRFKMGAYTAKTSFSAGNSRLINITFTDPNAADSLEALNAGRDYLETAEITEDELKGYILNAYGTATQPSGLWTDEMDAIMRHIYGVDEDK
nr:insulinase family protein [Lachnospiraceae bacterium]